MGSASTLIRLAWRNVWRQRRRTILLVVVVAYATLSTVFFWGLTEGESESILDNQARYIAAPALITTPAYQNDPDPENALPTLDFIDAVRQVSGVGEVAPRLEFFGLLRSPYTSQSVQVRGIVPGLEPSVSRIPESVSEGRMIESRGEIVLGYRIAEDIDVRLGERLALDVAALLGPQAAGLRVVGLVDAGIPAVDQNAVLVHIDDARALTGVDTATGVALDVPRGREAQVASTVQPVLPDSVRAYGLLDLVGSLSEIVESGRIAMIPIGLLFAMFAALAVTSTVFVSVIERSREFGMMAAIGMAPPKLARMVVFEALTTTVVGWLVGLVIGYGITWMLGTWNILGPLYASIGDSFSEFGIGEEFYTTSKPIYALYAAATVAFAAVFALIVPARKVAGLEPAQAMRAD